MVSLLGAVPLVSALAEVWSLPVVLAVLLGIELLPCVPEVSLAMLLLRWAQPTAATGQAFAWPVTRT